MTIDTLSNSVHAGTATDIQHRQLRQEPVAESPRSRKKVAFEVALLQTCCLSATIYAAKKQQLCGAAVLWLQRKQMNVKTQQLTPIPAYDRHCSARDSDAERPRCTACDSVRMSQQSTDTSCSLNSVSGRFMQGRRPGSSMIRRRTARGDSVVARELSGSGDSNELFFQFGRRNADRRSQLLSKQLHAIFLNHPAQVFQHRIDSLLPLMLAPLLFVLHQPRLQL